MEEVKQTLPKRLAVVLLTALEDRIARRITQQELDDICYKWTFHYAWDEFIFRPYPSKSVSVREWMGMEYRIRERAPEYERAKRQKEVVEYLNEWSKRHNENTSKYLWLKQIEKRFRELKDSKLDEVEEKVNSYKLKDYV